MFRQLLKVIAPLGKTSFSTTKYYYYKVPISVQLTSIRKDFIRKDPYISWNRYYTEQKSKVDEPVTPYQPVTEKLDKTDPNYPWKVRRKLSGYVG